MKSFAHSKTGEPFLQKYGNPLLPRLVETVCWQAAIISYLRDTAKIFSTSIRLFITSVTWPFSGPCFTFSLPIRYTDLGVRIKSLLIPWAEKNLYTVSILSVIVPKNKAADWRKTNLEPAVEFCDFVCKINLFSLGQKLSQLRPVIHTQVITYKVSVEAVSSPLLPVQ